MRKNQKSLLIYFTRYVHNKSIKVFRLYWYEIIGKIEEHEGKRYLLAEDYMLYRILDKIKEIIGIAKFDDTKILIDTDDKLSDNITLKSVLILITCNMVNFIQKYF